MIARLNQWIIDRLPERWSDRYFDWLTFTCKVCGLKTHDLTHPCPHWWRLLWRR